MTKKENEAKIREMKKAMKQFPKEIRLQERAHREEMKIRKAFGKLSLNLGEGSQIASTYQALKSLWKKLGINGQVKNFSSKEFWVLETDSGKAIAHRLPAGYKTPPTVDCDAFKRTDGKLLEGHGNWWKFYDFSTVELFDEKGGAIHISALTKTAVDERHFGEPTYERGGWGSCIKLVTDVKRDHQRKITAYFITQIGWVTPDQAFSMACRHEIDNARPVFPKLGSPYLRIRRDLVLPNNISTKGLV